MSILDIIIFLVLVVGFILGYKDGFVRKLIGLIGFILAIYLGITFSQEFGSIIESAIDIEIYLAEIIGGITIFMTIIIIFSILKRFIHPFDKVNMFINQFVGGIIGAVQIAFFLSAVFLFLNIFSFPSTVQRNNSFSYNFVLDLIPRSIDLIIGKNAKASDYLIKYIEKKDSDPNSQIDLPKIKK